MAKQEQSTATVGRARKMIATIDKRIAAVRRELMRDCKPFDRQSAHEWQRAWDSRPGLQGIENSLYARRGHWQEIRDEAEWKRARAAERMERRRFKKAPFRRCEHCGSHYYATA